MPGSHARLGAWLTPEQTEQRARELLRERGLSGEQIALIRLTREP
jgi:hypothetical protein